jgi:phosphoribosyl 1,2-cyclic phosphodiesterase
MQAGYYPLASGSQGNCAVYVSDEAIFLIDAGISCRATERHLADLNLSLKDIKAILITHEHGDHIKGLKTLYKKCPAPILANSGTARGIVAAFGETPRFKIFSTGESFRFLDVDVHPFSVQHDTMDPVGFTLQSPYGKLGWCTDLGFVTTLVRTRLQNCDYLFVEANHDVARVHACPRPQSYKQRVLGRTGHLSNAACADLIEAVYHEGLQHVTLAHLSSECNSPQTALETVQTRLAKKQIAVPLQIAYQDRRSEAVLFTARLSSVK